MSLLQDLVIASRTCAEHGVIDAYGHVSVRCDSDPNRYWMARAVAPELITEADLLAFDLDSNRIQDGGPAAYNERYIHGEIYKLRPDVKAIVHNHSHAVVPFSCTGCRLRPIFHLAAFIGEGIPTWDIRDAQRGSDMLVRNSSLGQSLARTLGHHPAALMRGHGSVVVGSSLAVAVGRTIYLEHNAKMQMQAMQMQAMHHPEQADAVVYLDEAEVDALSWQEYARSWDLWRTKWLPRLAAEATQAQALAP
jgi:HCOMODA/2-hydroxy-3-carboxy-muconic semialdehyde decarboxylase